ncbi:MAG: LysM peptidoglycan-binding domain-containing protein [Acidimicrobiales bacterium]
MSRREQIAAGAVLAGAICALILAQVISPAWVPSASSLRLARYAHYMSAQVWAVIVAGIARVVGLVVLVGELRTAWVSRHNRTGRDHKGHPALAGLALVASAMSFAGARTAGATTSSTPVAYELALAKAPAPKPPKANTPTPATYTVAPGDDLFAIAGKLWNNPEAWTHLWVANRGNPAPGGRTFTDPAMIWPGQVLHIPTNHAGALPADWTQVPWSGPPSSGSSAPATPQAAPGSPSSVASPSTKATAADPAPAPKLAKTTKPASEPASAAPANGSAPKVPRAWSAPPASKTPAAAASTPHHKSGGDGVIALPVAVGVGALALGLRRRARIARQRRQAKDVPPRITPGAAARLRQMDARAKVAGPTITGVRAVLCECERQAARMAEHVAPPQLVGLITGADEVEVIFAAPTPVPPVAPARTLAPNRWAIDPKAIVEPGTDAPALALVPLGVAAGRLVWADLVGIGPRLRLVGSDAKALASAWAAAISTGVGTHHVSVRVAEDSIGAFAGLTAPANDIEARRMRGQEYRYGLVHNAEALLSRQAQGSASTPWWATGSPTKVLVCADAPDELGPGEVAIIVGGEPGEAELVIDTSAPSLDLEAFGLGTLSLVLPEAGDVEALDEELARLGGPGEALRPLIRPTGSLHRLPPAQPEVPEHRASDEPLLGQGDQVITAGEDHAGEDHAGEDAELGPGAKTASVTTLEPPNDTAAVRLLGIVEGLEGLRGKDYKVAVYLGLHRGEVRREHWCADLGVEMGVPASKVISRIRSVLGADFIESRDEVSSYCKLTYDALGVRSDLDRFDELAEAGDYVAAFSLVRGPVCCGEAWLDELVESRLLHVANARAGEAGHRAAAELVSPDDRLRVRTFVELGFPNECDLMAMLRPTPESGLGIDQDFDAGWDLDDDAAQDRYQTTGEQGPDDD